MLYLYYYCCGKDDGISIYLSIYFCFLQMHLSTFLKIKNKQIETKMNNSSKSQSKSTKEFYWLFYLNIAKFFLPDGTNYLPDQSMMTSCTGKMLPPVPPSLKLTPWPQRGITGMTLIHHDDT